MITSIAIFMILTNPDPTALLFVFQRGRDAGGARQKVRLRANPSVYLHTYLLTYLQVYTRTLTLKHRNSHVVPTPVLDANSVVRLNQTHAAKHTICGLCVPRRRCPAIPLSLRLKQESAPQDLSCVLTHCTLFRASAGARRGGRAPKGSASRHCRRPGQ